MGDLNEAFERQKQKESDEAAAVKMVTDVTYNLNLPIEPIKVIKMRCLACEYANCQCSNYDQPYDCGTGV